jgi:hypothetical protein
MPGVMRLRVALADRSGALAQVATVIGLHGGNIRSIDVHRGVEESAVDDLVVAFPVDPDLDAMRTDLAMNASARLLAVEPADAVDPVEGGLREVLGLIEGAGFADTAARLCGAPWFWTLPDGAARHLEAGRMALERNTAVWLRSKELPPETALATGPEAAVLAVPGVGTPPGREVAFLACPAERGFTDTEVARVEALAAIHICLDSP